MNEIEHVKSWVQLKIDYWEAMCAKHKCVPPIKKCQCDFEEGMEKGILDGFYQVMEFIEEKSE